MKDHSIMTQLFQDLKPQPVQQQSLARAALFVPLPYKSDSPENR
jgi:hypothetical protein